MKNQVNFVYDFEDDPVDELKHWLFLENVKLNQQKQQLESDREELEHQKEQMEKEHHNKERDFELREKKLEREKELFEKQWHVVERELVRMAKDRDRMAKEKAYIQKEKDDLKKMRQAAPSENTVLSGTFFLGISNLAGLKKRYRELMKIYHPDNENGHEGTVRYINAEYEKLKQRFS
jgi:chromosome segregation ATPase